MQSALAALDVEQVLAALAGLPEAERRALAPRIGEWLPDSDDWAARGDCLAVARLGTNSRRELEKDWRQLAGRSAPCAQALLDREPPWLESFATWLLERRGWFTRFWPLVRRLVRAGAIPRPSHPNYVLGMLYGVQQDEVSGSRADPVAYLRAGFAADPTLLEDDIWRVFEVEGARDAHLNHHWEALLLGYAADGTLSRDRLLDESLAALARDFAQHKAGWYSRFHEALAPTLAERTARVDRYLPLLTSRIRPTVVFAIEALLAVEQAMSIPSEPLLAYLPAALESAKKKAALQALGLLERQVGAGGREVLLAALAHPDAAVQRRAIELLEAWGVDESFLPALQPVLAGVSPTLAGRVERWLETPETEDVDLQGFRRMRPQPPRVAAVLAALDAGRLPRATGPQARTWTPIEPITGVEGLVAELSTLVESPDDAERFERVLDGISRLCAQPHEPFSGPLRKRVKTLVKRMRYAPFARWSDAQGLVCGLALAWLEGSHDPGEARGQLEGFFLRRIHDVARRAARGEPRPLLAAPTNEGGWIDARTLVERAGAAEFAEVDAVQALLRMAPPNESFQVLLDGIVGESDFAAAVRFALGEDTPPASTALHIAALRARDPQAHDPALPAEPDAGVAADWRLEYRESGRWTYLLLETEPPISVDESSWPTVALHEGGVSEEAWGGRAGFDEDLFVRMAAQVWPGHRDSYYAEGVRRLAGNLYGEAEHANRRFMEPLLASDEPFGAHGARLVALGLGCKRPDEWSLAIDVVVTGIEDGRLDGEALGAALDGMLLNGLLTPSRVAERLGEVARTSTLAALQVARCIERALRGEAAPRGVHTVLRLLLELSTEHGLAVTDPDARRWLEARKGSSQTAKAAKALLGLDTRPERAQALRKAAADALAGWR